MHEFAVRACDLVKVYRLYKSPGDRVLDVLGLLKGNSDRYREHRALDGVSFEIRRGEKVGIIGRNGAGKSTLLKLITRTIEPTSGTLAVEGATQALLTIGTGFHPEFTGRDNVVSYLAQLGYSGEKAARLTADIIAFAEVEDYIDQPVKTYSTGMGARLMFAASTVIEPDVLVIDEVLGVGDAYFARKSYERIRALCAENNATLLLVSHDIYSAAQICDRMIWIDRGRVKFDGPPKAAINLYEQSIKEQEEQRLRRKALLVPAVAGSGDPGSHEVLVEIKSADGKPLTGVLFFYEAALADGVETLARVDPANGRSDAETAKVTGNGVEVVYEASNWLTVDEAGRSDGLVLANYGQPYHKGSLRVRFRHGMAGPVLRLAVESTTDQIVVAVVYDRDQRAFTGGEAALISGHRTDWAVGLDTAKLALVSELVEAGTETRHGSGAVRITAADILDAQGTSVRTLKMGAQVTFQFAYERHEEMAGRKLEIIAAFQKDGVTDVMRSLCSPLELPTGRKGIIRLAISRLPLSTGRYTLTVLLAVEGYYASESNIFYSINPDVVDVLNRTIEFAVVSAHPAFHGTIFGLEADWQVTGLLPQAESTNIYQSGKQASICPKSRNN